MIRFFIVLFIVLNAAVGIMVASVLRIAYKGYDIIGTVIMALTVRFPKEKQSLPPIGDRQVLKQSVREIAEQVKIVFIMNYHLSLFFTLIVANGHS